MAIEGIITATIPEFRRLTGISRSRIYELLDAGEIESVHIGARRLIIVESYRRLIERQRTATGSPALARPETRTAPRQ
jgi:excisionase family DNA binding protein